MSTWLCHRRAVSAGCVATKAARGLSSPSLVVILAVSGILNAQGCSPRQHEVLRESISPDGQWKIQVVLDSRGSLVAVAQISDANGTVYETRVLDGLYDEPIDVKTEFEYRDVYCTNDEAGVSHARFYGTLPPTGEKSFKDYEKFRRPVIRPARPEK